MHSEMLCKTSCGFEMEGITCTIAGQDLMCYDLRSNAKPLFGNENLEYTKVS